MFYLIAQIASFLLIATVLGVGLGWWFAKNKQPAEIEYDEDKALIEHKHRLDKCHKENAKLRREAKQHKEQLEKLNAQINIAGDDNLAEKLEAANAQIQALMDDVQMRDDMIIALEKDRQ